MGPGKYRATVIALALPALLIAADGASAARDTGPLTYALDQRPLA
jgi:hypothetical protein